VECVRLPAVRSGVDHAWHLFTVQVDGHDRDAVVAALGRAEVGVTVNYPPVHLTRYFRDTFGHRPGEFPVTERIGGATISLPFYATMPEADVDEVVARLAGILEAQPSV
jgi:perosamine synthetase